jgi:hypothetical protein
VSVLGELAGTVGQLLGRDQHRQRPQGGFPRHRVVVLEVVEHLRGQVIETELADDVERHHHQPGLVGGEELLHPRLRALALERVELLTEVEDLLPRQLLDER